MRIGGVGEGKDEFVEHYPAADATDDDVAESMEGHSVFEIGHSHAFP